MRLYTGLLISVALMPSILMSSITHSAPASPPKTFAIANARKFRDAVWRGDMKTVRYLLKHGMPVDARSLIDAAQQGHYEIAHLLLHHGAPPNRHPAGLESALFWAAADDHRDVVRLLRDHGAYVTALPAAILGDVPNLERYLSKGYDPARETDYGGAGPVHWAAAKGRTGALRVLLAAGASTNARTRDGETPLHSAALDGQVEAARILLRNGAQVDAADEYGSTPLHYAAQTGSVETCRLLLHRAAKINAKNTSGRTPLMVAVQEGHRRLAAFLLDHGADIKATDNNGWTCMFRLHDPDTARLLARHGGKLTEQHNGWTLLHRAAAAADVPLVQYLVQRGLKVNSADRAGLTALHAACVSDCHCGDTANLPRTAAMRARQPHRDERDVDARDRVVRLLLTHGAKVNAEDKEGRTPYDHALGNERVRDILQKHGGRKGSRKSRT